MIFLYILHHKIEIIQNFISIDLLVSEILILKILTYKLKKIQVAQAGRRMAIGWTARIPFWVSEGWWFSSLLYVQTGPGVHSASC